MIFQCDVYDRGWFEWSSDPGNPRQVRSTHAIPVDRRTNAKTA